MIDIVSLGLAHLLLVIAVIRLARRSDLDHDPAPDRESGEGSAGR